jgi:hypothetical protein
LRTQAGERISGIRAGAAEQIRGVEAGAAERLRQTEAAAGERLAGARLQAGERLQATREQTQRELAGARFQSSEQLRQTRADLTDRLREIRDQRREQLKAFTEAGQELVAKAEGPQPVIKGRTLEELEGRSNEELKAMHLEAEFNQMKSAGIHSPMAFFNIIYGLTQIAFGSPFGLLHLVRGGAITTLPDIVRSPRFQRWMVRESEVEPSNVRLVTKLTQGLERLYPRVRAIAKTGAFAGTMRRAAEESKQQDLVPSTQ